MTTPAREHTAYIAIIEAAGRVAERALKREQWEYGTPFAAAIRVSDDTALRSELIQLAAVTIAAIESMDRQREAVQP